MSRLDVVFNDVNGYGLVDNTINGGEFRVYLNNIDITTSLNFSTPEKRFGTTWRYNFDHIKGKTACGPIGGTCPSSRTWTARAG